MEMKSFKDAFNTVTKKQKLSSSKSQDIIEQISHEIEETLSKIQSLNQNFSPSDLNLILTDLKTRLKDISLHTQLEGTQKQLNTSLTKYPKLLEKTFNPDISKAYRNIDFDSHTINQIIATHFYREGQFELGDCFINEAKEQEFTKLKAPFIEMYQIIEALKSLNLAPALNWATTKHSQLEQNGSNIELKLHTLQFIEILQKKGRDEALKYARTFFAPFAKNHMSEIQKLMACLLWAGKLEGSPYSDLLLPIHWDSLIEEVTCQYCNMIGYSFESPLSVTISAGIQGLPSLLKLMNVMIGKKQEWFSMKQLPVPVDLDKEFQFHSVFVCPVSRDQASEDNPPMIMSCGHVLCKQSITKLSKNNSTRPFKCPYCPFEVVVGQCRELHF